MGPSVGLSPELLCLRRGQEMLDGLRSRRPHRGGNGTGQAGQVGWEALLQGACHVDVLVELVDDIGGQQYLDVLLGEHVRTGLHPRVGVERLAPDPNRCGAEDGEERGDDNEDGYGDGPYPMVLAHESARARCSSSAMRKGPTTLLRSTSLHRRAITGPSS